MITPKSIKEYTYEDLFNLEIMPEFNGMMHFRNTLNNNEYCTNKNEWESFLIGLHLRDKYVEKLEAIVDYVTDLAYEQNKVQIDQMIQEGTITLDESVKEVVQQTQENIKTGEPKTESAHKKKKKKKKK